MAKFFNKAIFYDQWSKLWGFIIVIVFVLGMKPIEIIGTAKEYGDASIINNLWVNLNEGDYFFIICVLITMTVTSIGINKHKSLSFLNSKNVTRKQILGTQLISTLMVSMISVAISILIRVIAYISLKQQFNISAIDIAIYFLVVSVVIINVLTISFLYQLLFGKTILAAFLIPATIMYLLIGPITVWRINYHNRIFAKLGDGILEIFCNIIQMATQGYLRGDTFWNGEVYQRIDAVIWAGIILGITVGLLLLLFLLNKYYEVQNLSNLFVFNKSRVSTNLLLTIIIVAIIGLILYVVYGAIHEKTSGQGLRIFMINSSAIDAQESNAYEKTVRFICNTISFIISPLIYMLLNKLTNVIDGIENKKDNKIKI